MTTVDYTVVVGDTECTIVELSETASLADARTEIELDAVDIQEIPRDFLFLYKGVTSPLRREQTRKVADATGAEARLHIVAAASVATVPAATGDKKLNFLCLAKLVLDELLLRRCLTG